MSNKEPKPQPESLYALVARNHGFKMSSEADAELVGSVIAEINHGVSVGSPDEKLEAVASLGSMGVASQIMHDRRVLVDDKGGEYEPTDAKTRLLAAKEYRESARQLADVYRRTRNPEKAKRVEESEDVRIARREGLL